MILSHPHLARAGGLLPTYRGRAAGKKELVFPKAKFIVGADAWNRALHPHSRDKASFIPELTGLLKDSGRLIVHGKDPLPTEISSRFEFIETQGHTPGQMHTLFKGDKQKVFFCGDLIPGRPWVHLPITMGYDRFPEKLIDEKAAVYQRAEKEHWLLFFTHDPSAPASEVKASATGKFEPVQVRETLERFPL